MAHPLKKYDLLTTMKHSVFRLISCCFLLSAFTACVSTSGTSTSEYKGTQKALAAAEGVVVHFQVEQAASSAQGNRRPRTVRFSGIVLSEEGHLLAPFNIKPDTADRIEAWIGEDRYLARSLKAEPALGMSILKIQPKEPLTPVDLNSEGNLTVGESAFAVVGSNESNEFARFSFRAYCQGIIEGFYRQFSLSSIPNSARGAPLFDTAGNLVGIVMQNNAWVLDDIRPEIQDLLAGVRGEGEKPGGSDKVWFGAILSPINPDYARDQGLPRSALWLVKVFEETGAHEAGFQNGDLLVSLNGNPLRMSGTRTRQYFNQALRPREGQTFEAEVLRGGKRVSGEGTLTKRPEPSTLQAEDLGVTVSEINSVMETQMNLFESEGVMVTKIKRGSPAATGRQFGQPLLRNRDVITSLGGIPTPDLETFKKALDQVRQEQPEAVLVTFKRGPVDSIEALNLLLSNRNTSSESL